MSRKEILTILFMLCFILSLQTVMAADVDNNNTALTAHDLSVVASSDVSAYSLPNSNEILQAGSDSADSFSKLQDEISPGGSITLDKNYTWNSSSDSEITEGITINQETHIIGYGVIIDAQKKTRVFNIASGVHVTLEGITFINGNGFSSNGGSILSAGTLSIINCTFMDNTVTTGDGGAIYTTADGNRIVNSTFLRNTASGSGGAVKSGTTTIIHSIFEFNKNTRNSGNGGAVNIGDNSVISNSTFVNNTARGAGDNGGGAVYATYNLTVNNHSNFINNTVGTDGGALTAGNLANISNATFINNTASTRAGALRVGDNAVISYCNFTNNTGSTYGGAISAGVNPEFYNSRFINNRLTGTSATSGGAINTRSDVNIKIISGCTFINNTAKEGGAVKTAGSIYIIGSVFINNTASTSYGGAISGATKGGVNLTVVNCNFTGNNASTYGGAIYTAYSYIYDSNFNSSYARNVGGAIYSTNTLVMNNTNFTSNWAVNDGGAIRTVTATITHSNFNDNNATNTGGAIKSEGTITISNSTFTNNRITGNGGSYGGGAIATGIGTTNTRTYIYDSNFTNNTATSYGGAIRTNSANAIVIINNTTFTTNHVYGNNRDGGALYITSGNSIIGNSTFIKNTAVRYGGDIYWNGLNGRVEHSNFTGSNATSGGSIYWNNEKGNIVYSNFTDTRATNGGAIYITSPEVSVANSIFKNNNATYGGAIYTNGPGTKISYSNFTGNNATSGGAIYTIGTSTYAQGTRMVIEYSNFTNNHAISNAGAVYMGYNGEINDCNFTDDTATNGGAVVIAVSDATIERSIFEGNNATLYGGSVYVQTVDRSYIYDSTFRASFAYNGGAIYNEGNSGAGLTIGNDTFIKNIASHNGGAIYYVVDKGGGNKTKIYRDQKGHFEDELSVGGGRISVTIRNNASATYGQLIANCLFVDNDDYLLNVSGKSMNVVSGGVISIYNPKDIDFTNFKIIINLTQGDTLITQLTINQSNWDPNWYNPSEKSVNINIRNLMFDEVYNVTVGFTDTNYLYKEGNSSFRVTGNSDLGDFQVIKKLIQDALDRNENEITLTRPFEYNEIDIAEHTGCINITTPTSFTINGNGNSIDANGYCRIFYVTSANVTFNNVILRGGNATGIHTDGDSRGGAVLQAGVNATFEKVTFDNNYAGIGGGLYLNYTANGTTINNCIFTNNIAVGNGGAIDCNASKMRLTYTSFDSNYGVYGAALCREAKATEGSGEFNNFTNNHAVKGGAALGWIKAQSIVIKNYIFINNTAGESGGAIFVSEDSISCKVINSTFEGNYIDNETSGHGGAIEWYANEGTVIDSNFTNNHAFDGGAIYANDESEKINITNSRFTDNYAYSRGGAISLEASQVHVLRANFTNNTARNGGGGAIYVGGNGAYNNVLYSNFTNNKANCNGGAIDWVASAGQVLYSNFTNNSAVYGGAIYLNGASHHSLIANVTFKYNNASKNGGAIDWNATNGELYNNTFISNEADYGAALCREAGARGGNGSNNNFISNHARISGAALGWMGSDNITIRYYTFINNTADVSGGAIYVGNTSNNCSVINCIFEGNHLTSHNETAYGGAIDWRGADGKVRNSNFTGNHAYNGGAIFVGTDHGVTNITNSNFTKNNAHKDGGAININASSVYLYDCHLDDNNASSGGALFVGEKGDSNYIYRSTFDNNKAIGEEGEISHGGAINWLSAAGNILYSNFTNNTADYGGAIYLNGKSKDTVMNHLLFDNNTANYNGGAIDWNAENGELYNTTFRYNKAQYGAALCREVDATGGNGKDNVFEYNHAYKSGAALAWMGSVGITITNYTFNYNTANVGGAAIYIASGSHNCSIIDSRFTGNEILNETGGHGGAIYTIAQNTTVRNTNFTDNRAHYGGAIFVGSAGGSTNITDSQFRENKAVNDGGAIYLISSHTIINRTKFYNNTATNGGALNAAGTGEVNQVYLSVFDGNRANNGYGGAINWVASAGYIYYSNFTNNYAKYGGAIHFNGLSDNSKVSHVRFENNTAAENGGAIECNSSEMELTYTDFISNYAKYGAALCREIGATGGFGYNNTFVKNHAYISGAALAWMDVSNIRINNYTFTNNTADVSGAAIYVSDDSDHDKVHNCLFEDNYITSAISGRGGAIDWIGDDGEVINTTFIRCAAIEGGAIYVAETSNNMNIENTSFTSCQSNRGNGGALQLRGSNVTIILSNFTSCYSIKSGGAIAPIDSDNLTVISSRFISCLSLDFGGAIAGIRSDDANITDCYFKYNHASGHTNPDGTIYGEGGAIYWGNSNNLNIYDSDFYYDNAFMSGGAISANNCNDSVAHNIKTYNETAEFNGGSISWVNSRNVTIEQSLFNDSGASYSGGSIYLKCVDNVTVKDSLLNSTWASWGNGGGLYVEGNVTINNITLIDGHDMENVANGIYFVSGKSTVVNSTFNETTNVIYIAKDATINLTNNNITGDYPTKNVTFVLKNNVTDKYEVSYAVWNGGTLSLYNDYNDTFDYVIINNGTIKTHVTVYVLNNDTVTANWNDNYLFKLRTIDDNNNTIISVKSTSWNNVTGPVDPYFYPLDYNAAPLNTIYQGSYRISATDLGFEDYTIKTGTINVKVNTKVELTYEGPENGRVKVNVKVVNLTQNNVTFKGGKVLIKLGDKLNTTTILDEDGMASWIVDGLAAKSYGITAEYEETISHNPSQNSTGVDVIPWDSWIRVQAAKVAYGSASTAVITSNSNGTVVVTINGKKYTEVVLGDDRREEVALPNDLLPGTYSIGAILLSNSYYGFNMNNTDLIVMGLNTTIHAVPTTPIKVGGNEIIDVTVNETAAQGFIKITINGKSYIEEITGQGRAQFNISGLAKGTYNNVPVEYLGDDIYNGNSTKVSFVIGATDDYEMKVITENITYGQNATIYVVLPDRVTENLTIYVNDEPHTDVVVKNGIATLIVPNLDVESYVVNVTYPGDDLYSSKDDKGNIFTVSKAKCYPMNVTALDVAVGLNTTITVTVPDDATGSVTIWVNKTTQTKPVSQGKAIFSLNKTAEGKYSINATLTDTRYDSKTVFGEYYVYKVDTPITISGITNPAYSGGSATITVTVPEEIDEDKLSIEINGKPYGNGNKNGNTVTFTVPDLTYGNKTVVATYSGDSKYKVNSTTKKFTVIKHDSTIKVEATNKTVGQDVTINVTVTPGATGYVVINVNGTNYTINLTAGQDRVILKDLGNGTYNVIATYLGDDQFLPNGDTTSFKVSKLNATGIVVKADNINYTESAIIIVTVPDGITGNITLRLNDTANTHITLPVFEGKVNWTVDNLAAGKYKVSATYNGNYKYNVNASLFDTFEVKRIAPVMYISTPLVYTQTDVAVVGDRAEIVVVANANLDGETVVVNGLDKDGYRPVFEYSSYSKSSIARFITDGPLEYKQYTINAIYGGNQNYTDKTATYRFTPAKISNYEITVNPRNITFKDDEIITVDVPDGVTSVSIWVNSTKVTNDSVVGTHARFDVTHIITRAGVYFVNATVNDEQYASKVANNMFTVAPRNTTLFVDVHNVDIWNREFINVTIKDAAGKVITDASGNLTINVNGVNHSARIVGGVARYNTTDLVVGTNTVAAFYAGEVNYVGNYISKTFTVNQRTPSADVSATNRSVDSPVTITVTIPANATGFVIITGNFTDNEIYVDQSEFTSGVATVTVNGLAEDVYSVHMTYYGLDNDQYRLGEDDTTFKVYKLNTTVGITADSVDYGGDVNVVVTVDDGVEGTITIKLGDKTIGTYAVLDNKVEVNLTGLAADDYTVYAIYNGNGKYNINDTESKDFTVRKATPVITIDKATTDANTSAVITVHINDTATGTLNITVNGKPYEAPINNGVAEFTIDVLPVGEYNIIANYYALTDTNYTVNSNTLVKGLNVTKVKCYPMNVSTVDVKSGENTTITVYVPGDATGKVFIDVNGTKLNKTVSEGKAVFNVAKEIAGRYVVNATLSDSKYANKTIIANYYVSHRDTPLGIDVDEPVYANDTAKITVTVPDGIDKDMLSIEINGKTYSDKTITSDGIVFEVPNITHGDKTVVAVYAGDNVYSQNSTTKNFTVNKKDSSISVDATNKTVGQDVTINVTVTPGATGYVVVNVNGTNYTINMTAGEDRVAIKDLGNGTYNVIATYIGDETYLPEADTTSFTVSKLNTTVRIDVDDITYGDDANITVHVDNGVEGTITIRMDSEVIGTYDIVDGKVNVSVHKIGAGEHTVYAEYNGNYKYNENRTASRGFTVYKATPTITVDSVVVDANTSAVIYVHINPDAAGNITITVDGNGIPPYVYEAPIVEGVAKFPLGILPVNKYNITAEFYDDEHHGIDTNYTMHSVEAIYALIVNKVTDYPITVNATDVNAGENSLITVVVPKDATGSVVIHVNGTVDISRVGTGGITTFEVSKDVVGKYNVTAVLDDDKYDIKYVYCSYYVEYADIPLSIDVAEPVYEGDTAVITVTVPEDIKGEVTIEIDGKSYNNVSFVDDNVTFKVPGLTPGNKTVVAIYEGDAKYANNATTDQFEVLSIGNIILDVENITYGDVETVTVNINTTGSVTLKLNNETYDTKDISSGKVVFPIEGLDAGNYTVEAIYIDVLGNATSAKANFTVEKANPTVNVEVKDIAYGDVEHIKVNVNARGNVTIKVNGEVVYELTLENGHYVLRAVRGANSNYQGSATVDVENLDAGKYPVEVTYNGNDNYNSLTVTKEFYVVKANTTVSAEMEQSIGVGETQIINITIGDENATGEVVINIDGKNYTRSVTNGVANFTIPALPAGNHTVVVIYNGDKNFNSNWTSSTFEIIKSEHSIYADITNNTSGSDQTITVHGPENSDGYAIVTVDNETYAVKLNNGTGNVTVKGLTSGSHKINVSYLGDDNYAPSTWNTTVQLSKAPSSINVAVENITAGDKAVIEISVPDDATGNVTVNIDGENHTVYVAGGKGTLVLPDLGVGPHKVTVTYNGDDKYDSNTNSTSFEVTKQDSSDVVKVTDQGNGTLVVEVPEGSEGNVTVKVGNDTYTGEIKDGKAIINLDNATPGVHDVTITVPGNENHADTVVDTQVTIPKYASQFNITVENTTTKDSESIVVKVPEGASGNVTIEIDGKSYTRPIIGGEARFEIDNLTAGNKTAVIRYDGDENFEAMITSANFTVSKVTPPIKITIDDSKVGENVTVDVVLPDDASGVVLIDIGGVGYYANVTDGVAHVEIPRIPSGNYDVAVTYPGDDKYSSATNNTSFNMSQVESFVIPNVVNITYGENEVITITVPSDATGNVTLIIDGVEYAFNANGDVLSASTNVDKYSVAVSGGKGVFVISELPEGEYTVSVRYNGDDKYLPSTNSTKFKVSKSKSSVEVIDQGNGTVVVMVPEDAGGNVTVKIGNETYPAKVVNGTAVITLENTTPGVHTIEVTYSGDSDHESKTVTSTVVIPKYETPISVEADNINVGDTLKVVIDLPDGVTGNVTVEIDGKEYPAEIDGGKAIVNITDLTAGNKTLIVKFDGNDYYLPNTTTKQFTVSKISSTLKASPIDITAGKDEVITVEVPKDATGRVLVDVDGVGYYADIVNGKAKVIIPELAGGNYKVNVTYEGDDKYLPYTTTASFKVAKANAPVSITDKDIKVGDDETITVNLPSDATGNVTIIIDGKSYTEKVTDGKAVFVIPGLAKGTYNITAVYSGDRKYDGNETSSVIEVQGNDTPINNRSVIEGEGIALSDYPTANPIFMLLLMLIAIGSTQLRKLKK